MAPALLEPLYLPTSDPQAHIIDIRNGAHFTPLAEQIRCGLNVRPGHEKRLPTLLLYDKAGLQLFEKITYLDEYYLTNDEISILERCADRIAERVALKPDSIVLELGSGNLRKVRLLLEALERRRASVSYYALDLSRDELERTLADIPPHAFNHVKCFGLWGTYDDGLAWLKRPKNLKRSKTILSLGSSIGNFERREAAEFLARFRDTLGPHDSFLIGVDACTDSAKVYHAYNDKFGLTHEFILNGLNQANHHLGHNAFNISDWEVVGEYDEVNGRHHAFVAPRRDVDVEGLHIAAGERVRIEESYKYTPAHLDELFRSAGLTEGARWANEGGYYALHLLNRPPFQVATKPAQYANQPVPTLDEFRGVWQAWDAVARRMLPDEELLDKPIKLRNACIFYLGHIPAFLDIHISRATDGKATEPGYFHQIFERGIDPDVDDPTQCHAHSEIPDEWPAIDDILIYQNRVRQRVERMLQSSHLVSSRKVQRALWLGLEHEMMHLETLLYMLVQSEKTLPPPGTIRPDFEALSRQAEAQSVRNEWFTVPSQEIIIGIDDPDDDTSPPHFMGWDNELPARSAKVDAFQIKARPITNREFAIFLENTSNTSIPASWAGPTSTLDGCADRNADNNANGRANGHVEAHDEGLVNGPSNGPSDLFLSDKSVRTVFGPVPLRFALDWPVAASFDELSSCAAYMGGRIPTFEETRASYQYAEMIRKKQAEQSLAETIPAVNAHLINNGVQESPPPQPHHSGNASGAGRQGPSSEELFIDLTHTNTAFKHWHPEPVSAQGNRLGGQGDMGGLWEWTSTTLAPWDGFKPMDSYPGYTSDFFDGKHNIVLGGSWATLPRIAGRKSFVNWYQRNYPYVWAGARLARDIM